MIEWVVQQLQTNEMLQAAVVAAPVTALVFTARTLPMRLYRFIMRQLTLHITFTSDLPDYLAVQEFVGSNVVSQGWSRRFVYAAERKWDREAGDDKVVHLGLTPGYGLHFGWWQGRLVWVSRELEPSQQTDKFKERLTLTFLTSRRSVLRAFAARVREVSDAAVDQDCISLFINSGGWWRFASKLPKRSLDTVFTSNGEAGQLLEQLRAFEGRRDWYRERGLPWHIGVLLSGKPGTGKTSLLHAVASAMGRTLHYLNLGSVEHDGQLTELVSGGRNWSRAILVVEDADATGAQVTRDAPAPVAQNDGAPAPSGEPRKPLTLSALLNVLDGLLTPDGLIVIATTNHPERLDPALIRAGRFDLHLEIGDLDWPAFVAMAQRFGEAIGEDDPRRAVYRPAPGAVLRARLLDGGLASVLPKIREAA